MPSAAGGLLLCEGKAYKRTMLALRLLQVIFAAVVLGALTSIPWYFVLPAHQFSVTAAALLLAAAAVLAVWMALRSRGSALGRGLRARGFVHGSMWTDAALALLTFMAACSAAGVASVQCLVTPEHSGGFPAYVRPACGTREDVTTAFLFGGFAVSALAALLGIVLWRDLICFSDASASGATVELGADVGFGAVAPPPYPADDLAPAAEPQPLSMRPLPVSNAYPGTLR